MDGQEYLNQISASNRPIKPPKKGLGKIFSSIYFKLGVGTLAALAIIGILSSVILGGKTSFEDQLVELKLHIDGTMQVINTYQSNVKSSDIRSGSASLYSVLSNTSTNLTAYLTENYNYKSNSVDKNLTEAAKLEQDALSNDLFEAKITGQLDRAYVGKMTYEISSIYTSESKILKSTNSETLKSILENSSNSLSTLYDQFKNF